MRFRTALVLGGGGVRGFAHIGVLKILEREKFPIDLIVGTSMGAIIGAGYALHKDVRKIEEIALEVINMEGLKELEEYFLKEKSKEDRAILNRFGEIIKNLNKLSRLKRKWIFEAEKMRDAIKELIPEEVNFSDLKIPFACVAVDILSGERIIFKEGNLLDAVIASSTVPGVFPPFKKEKYFLVDGGVVSKLPVKEAHILGTEFSVAVDVGAVIPEGDVKDGIDIILKVNRIMSYYLNEYNVAEADFIIKPAVEKLSWVKFSEAKFCIHRGEEEADQFIADLKRAWRKKKFKSFFRLSSHLPLTMG